MTSMSALAFAFKVKRYDKHRLCVAAPNRPQWFHSFHIQTEWDPSREPCQALSPCHHGPYSCGNIWLVRLAHHAILCGTMMWWGNLNQMLPPSSWRQQACWDGFMKRLWFGPCKMQTRRVVPQTLKSKWGMEKHFNSSCLSVFFWGIVWVPVSLPQVCRKLATKSYKLVWFILILVAKTVLLNFGSLTFAYTAALLAYLPRLSQLGFVKHAIQPSQLWFPELQLGPLWLGQQRIVPWAQCSKSGQPWKVVAIEILLNRSCHFFFSGTSAWSEGNLCWIWWYDFIYFHSGIRVTAKSYYTFQPCTVRLSFTWGAGGQVAERAWMQNDWILGITKKINDKHIDLNQHPENSVWALAEAFLTFL